MISCVDLSTEINNKLKQISLITKICLLVIDWNKARLCSLVVSIIDRV